MHTVCIVTIFVCVRVCECTQLIRPYWSALWEIQSHQKQINCAQLENQREEVFIDTERLQCSTKH